MKFTLQGVGLAMAIALPACYDFHIVGPEDPPPLESPLTATVSLVYLQPSGCVNTVSPCEGPVSFHASWLKLGEAIVLEPSSGHTWVATLRGVPVNFPGTEPHRVYAVDPYLFDTPTRGVSADRLTVGGQRITAIENRGGAREQGLIFIDASGRGRNP